MDVPRSSIETDAAQPSASIDDARPGSWPLGSTSRQSRLAHHNFEV